MYMRSILVLGSINTGEMRPLYLLLLIVAISLLLTGCCIALVTLRNLRKGQFELVTPELVENEQQ
jgi:uncharacterized membrane protein YozB (DUF420 family)